MNNNRENYAMFIVCNIFTHHTTHKTNTNNIVEIRVLFFVTFFSIIIYEHPVYRICGGNKKCGYQRNASIRNNSTFKLHVYIIHSAIHTTIKRTFVLFYSESTCTPAFYRRTTMRSQVFKLFGFCSCFCCSVDFFGSTSSLSIWPNSRYVYI